MIALRRGRRSGVSSIEFALLMPIMLAMLVGLLDWGLAIDQRIQLQTAVRAGAQYALRNPTDTAGITAAVRAAAADRTLTVGDPVIFCECNGGAASCTATCDSGLQRFLSVSANQVFVPLTPAGPTSVSADVTLRVQ
jgi:Flp pilus assembly protein TadG